jgi:acylphosphatase
MNPAENERCHLLLYGDVQGVGFRVFARRAALPLGLAGYVRNRPDGSVEVEAEGPAPAVAAFRATIQQGPPYGTVRRAEEAPPSDRQLPDPFEIVR